jgi:NADH dehydrogenase
MTVLVTGASGSIGPSAVRAFLRTFPEVRAYVRNPEAADWLRGIGAKVAVGEADDEETLSIAMYGVFTVCHLVGAIDAPDEEGYRLSNAGSVEIALRAAKSAGVGRFLFLSSPGASPDAAHPYLRAKGAAESMIAGSGLEYAIVRSAHVYGPGPGFWFSTALELALLDPPGVLGGGDASIAPVFVEDVAAVLAAADDRSEPLRGTWGLEGPGAVTTEGFARLVNSVAGAVRHFGLGDAGEVAALLGRPVSSSALEYLAAESRADGPDAAREFGVTRTSLEDGLRRTIERSADLRLERWSS